MRTGTKVWLITAASLVLIGCVLFAGVMTSLGWDFMKLATVEYETNTHEISEAFDSISMNTDTADIVFAFSDDGKCRVECFEEEKVKHSVTVENGTLTIEQMDERTVSELIGYIGLNFGTPGIKVYLPKTEYAALLIKGDTGDVEIPDRFIFGNVDISLSTGDVDFCASVIGETKIKTSTGDICAEKLSAGSLDLAVSSGEVTLSEVDCKGEISLDVSTGEAYLTDVACKNLISGGSSGDISLERVIAAEKVAIRRDTGDIKLDGCDAAELSLETDTGDITGSLLTNKIFAAETSTGAIDVPGTNTGGLCRIRTDTGDIEIKIQ